MSYISCTSLMKNAIKCHQKMGGAKIGESLTMGDGVISQDILYHYKAMGWQVNSMYWSMNQRKCYSEIGNLSWKTTWLAILLHTWKISLYFTTETIVQYIFILNVELCILHPDPGLRNSIVCFGCVTKVPYHCYMACRHEKGKHWAQCRAEMAVSCVKCDLISCMLF